MAGEMTAAFVGNLTRDPQAGRSDGGTDYARFGVAHTPRVKRGQDWVDGETMFIDVSVFGRTAHSVMQSLKQGSRVFIYGRMTQSTWTADDGTNKVSFRCVPDYLGPEITFDAARHVPRDAQQAPSAAPQPAAQAPAAQPDPWASAGGQQPPSAAPW